MTKTTTSRPPHLVAAQASRMAKRRGNPNWGKPYPEMGVAAEPTAFEQLAKEHCIPEEAWIRSRILRDFARKNARHKYVPEALLEAWGIDSSDGGSRGADS
jgi:hypothetical protein